MQVPLLAALPATVAVMNHHQACVGVAVDGLRFLLEFIFEDVGRVRSALTDSRSLHGCSSVAFERPNENTFTLHYALSEHSLFVLLQHLSAVHSARPD